MTTTPPLDEAALRAHLDAFYAKVRLDPQLGPVFEAAVEDWPAHMDVLTDFWCTVALRTPRYKGNPFAVHKALPLPPAVFGALFPVWLGLWRETARERFPAPEAEALIAKAERIADSLKAGLLFDPGVPVRTA
ncbi:group III truncated hemoglobin [Aquabacter cavernae]|uniref:group III truncated hemoglobin n=1 Tax=Aquabacter cavernae TaxID=2496029 RepID=UPI000F8D3A63|nr:group III truncated hemoglobin [Aquabacter cavernae]